MMRATLAALIALLALLAPRLADAGPITIMVGDDDGYGIGLSDGGTLPWISPILDYRSAAEAAATNGAELTDLYSALYPDSAEIDCAPCSPNGVTGQVVLPFAGQLTSATLTIDMGDFQQSASLPYGYAPMHADINGEDLSLAFYDGWHATVVRSFVLTPAMLAGANSAGAVILNLDHSGTYDYIAFDYFKVDATVVPEPGSLLLFGSGLLLVARRIRRHQRATDAASQP